jgi:hypothetical protein
MPEVRYKVMAARPGELDIRFRINVGTRVIEVRRTFEWDGQSTFDAFIQGVVNAGYIRLLQLAQGTNLGQYVGRRGTATPHVPPFPVTPTLPVE